MITILPVDAGRKQLLVDNPNVLACPLWDFTKDFYVAFEEFGPTLIQNQVRIFLTYFRQANETPDDIHSRVESNINCRIVASFDIVVLIIDDIDQCEALTTLSKEMHGVLQLASAGEPFSQQTLSKISCKVITTEVHLMAIVGTNLPPLFASYLAKHFDCDGWYDLRDAIASDVLLEFQQRQDIKGHILEIGAYKGKSAAHLSTYARPEEALTLIDREMHATVESRVSIAHPRNNILRREWSFDIARTDPLFTQVQQYRWLHVDGGHSGEDVLFDINFVKDLVSSDGLIVIDDFYSQRYPQITWAVINWLTANANEFTPILLAQQKLFVCRNGAAQCYLRFFKDELATAIARRGIATFSIFKTTKPHDLNMFSLKFWEQLIPDHYVGPDWDRACIEI